MTLTNTSVQYVSAIDPGKTEPQPVKRMHYVSFVGIFIPICLKGFMLAVPPRNASSAADWPLAPGDQRRRIFRQIDNLRERKQQELADDHPIKVIYNRCMNTILQSTCRGKLDVKVAVAMKKLAKDRVFCALSDHRYASHSL